MTESDYNCNLSLSRALRRRCLFSYSPRGEASVQPIVPPQGSWLPTDHGHGEFEGWRRKSNGSSI